MKTKFEEKNHTKISLVSFYVILILYTHIYIYIHKFTCKLLILFAESLNWSEFVKKYTIVFLIAIDTFYFHTLLRILEIQIFYNKYKAQRNSIYLW